MRIQIHLPRQSEAEIEPKLREDITVRPKFYKRTGFVPVFYFTTVDAHNKEEKHVLLISAANKQIKVERLNEVIPLCDEKELKDADASGQISDEDAED